VQSQRFEPDNIYRCGVREREFTFTNWSDDMPRKPAGEMVQSRAGYGVPICDGSGVYCGLRGYEGCGLSEIGILTLPTLKTDSEGAYHLSKRPKFMHRSCHIEHRFHYLCQQVRAEKLTIHTIPEKDNPSDPLTKILPMAAVTGWKERWMHT